MSFPTILIILLLLLTAILGGGFGIREFKLPKAKAGVKITAFLTSLVLGISGLAAFQQSRKSNFSLTNNLTEGALRERIVLTIEGEEVGSVTSNTSVPSSIEEFTVPEAGTYSYSLELFGFYDNNGQEAPFHGQGSGVINVESGDIFEVQGEFVNNQLTLTLVEK
jgi:hypothetical protein